MSHLTNVFRSIPSTLADELFETLLQTETVKIERIVSQGHASPAGFWYDQPSHEWVLLLSGSACVRFDDGESIELEPGGFCHIPAHRRHRVEWTDAAQPTIWLAIHFGDGRRSDS